MTARTRAGSLEALQQQGQLRVTVGTHQVLVLWHEGEVYAIDDRCPHMGFPLHRGSVCDGLLTCHWHHARFDLRSGGTFDPWADDVATFPIEVVGDEVFVSPPPPRDAVDHNLRRLQEGLEQNITLVTAKAVLGLSEAGVPPGRILAVASRFGTANRTEGFSGGLTVLAAMANLLPVLREQDHVLALVHGLRWLAADVSGHAPAFALPPLSSDSVDRERLQPWFRQFIETRTADGAERTLRTALVAGLTPIEIERILLSAITDHPYIDEGHTLDFANKAFELLAWVGWDQASAVLASLVPQISGAERTEEESAWRHPVDLIALGEEACARLPAALAAGAAKGGFPEERLGALGVSLLCEDPRIACDLLLDGLALGATLEQAARAVAYAAALRITRFPIQNDHQDWNIVHHGFTHANALHQCLVRSGDPLMARGLVHALLKVHLDRFLNIPTASIPKQAPAGLQGLQSCWDEQGHIDEAGAIAYHHVRKGGDVSALIADLGAALLQEDANFHWYQAIEAAIRQARAWPDGSEEQGQILAGAARFLAAHTPTRRERAQVVKIATRLRRGERFFEEIPTTHAVS